MKLLISIALFFGVQTAVFAGWGAIAYNPQTGASGRSFGWGNSEAATQEALHFCGWNCFIVNVEFQSCIALATGRFGRWAEAHGYLTPEDAARAALFACGPDCFVHDWACH